jgi:hypothetical protein
LTLVDANHITASLFINDDERGLHADHEMGLEGLVLQSPLSQYQHYCTGEDACPGRTGPPTRLKQNGPRSAARDGPRGGGCGDRGTAGSRCLGAVLSSPDRLAGPGVLTAGGGSGCWSRTSGNQSLLALGFHLGSAHPSAGSG